MNRYSLIIVTLVFTSCVQVAQLNMEGTPVTGNEVLVYKPEPMVEEEYVYEPNPVKSYFSCQEDSLKVSYFSRTLEVKIDNSIGQCFGIYFEPRSIHQNVTISFKAKYTGSDTLDLAAGFTDVNGGKCDAREQLQFISSADKGFKTFEYKFEALLAAPTHSLDTTQVETVIIYPNTRLKNNLRGLLTIKDIEIQ